MQVPSMIDNSLKILNSNKYVSAILGLFLALYAGLAAPKLPRSITSYFDNSLIKLIFMFLIAYTSTKDPPVAIISAVALLVTLQTLSSHKTSDKVVDAIKTKVDTINTKINKSKYLENILDKSKKLTKMIDPFTNEDDDEDDTPPKTQIDDSMIPFSKELVPVAAPAPEPEPESMFQQLTNMVKRVILPMEEPAPVTTPVPETTPVPVTTPVSVTTPTPVMTTLPPVPVIQNSLIQPEIEQNVNNNSLCNQVNLNIGQKSNGCCNTLNDSIMGFDSVGDFASY